MCAVTGVTHVVQFPSGNFSELKSRNRKHYDALPHPRNEKWPCLNVLMMTISHRRTFITTHNTESYKVTDRISNLVF